MNVLLEKALDLSGIEADAQDEPATGRSEVSAELAERLEEVDLLISDLGQLSNLNTKAADLWKKPRQKKNGLEPVFSRSRPRGSSYHFSAPNHTFMAACRCRPVC